jgi:hypothetical protein
MSELRKPSKNTLLAWGAAGAAALLGAGCGGADKDKEPVTPPTVIKKTEKIGVTCAPDQKAVVTTVDNDKNLAWKTVDVACISGKAVFRPRAMVDKSVVTQTDQLGDVEVKIATSYNEGAPAEMGIRTTEFDAGKHSSTEIGQIAFYQTDVNEVEVVVNK